MRKIKKSFSFALILTITAAVSFAFVSKASAVEEDKNQGQDVRTSSWNAGEGNATSGYEGSTTSEGDAMSENTMNERATGAGQITAEEHQSMVANFVKSLLNVADREGGIGEAVRVIARQQEQSANVTVRAIERVQSRSKIKIFLLGSDYKNLGALRSEMVQTRNRIDQLNRLFQNATDTNATDTSEIQGQIQTLEQEQTKIDNFVKNQEGKFSLFGWLVKMFSK